LDLNLTNVALPAILGTVVGFASATYLFKTFIGKKYGTSKAYSKHAKIIYWCGLLAFICIGMGLSTIASELAYSVFNGKEIKGDNLAKGLLQAIAFPIIFFVVAFILNKVINDDASQPQSPQIPKESSIKLTDGESILKNDVTTQTLLKYTVGFVIIASIAFITYTAVKGNSSEATYDIFFITDTKNCNSPYQNTPTSATFSYKKETDEIFAIYEIAVNDEKKHQLIKLDDCSIINKNNWTCGGKIDSGYKSQKFTMVDGDLSFVLGGFLDDTSCPTKIVKR
jgi:hypothetical protein